MHSSDSDEYNLYKAQLPISGGVGHGKALSNVLCFNSEVSSNPASGSSTLVVVLCKPGYGAGYPLCLSSMLADRGVFLGCQIW